MVLTNNYVRDTLKKGKTACARVEKNLDKAVEDCESINHAYQLEFYGHSAHHTCKELRVARWTLRNICEKIKSKRG